MQNRQIRDFLIENGAIISEFLSGSKSDAVNFPQRNQIINGLSKGILVIEVENKNGAVITALNALSQNREIFVLPGRTDPHKSD